MAAILDNLRIFAAMMHEVLTNIRYWDVSCAIFDNLCWLILKISNALTSITQLFVEWIYWLTSYCLTVPCYVIKSVSTVVAKLWEIMVLILANLRLFTLKISDALTCITHRSMEWIYMLASYCLSVPRNVVNSILVIVANLWEILVAILDNLRLNILKIIYGVTTITNRFLKWIYLRASYCLAVPCYVLKLISIVVAKLWEMLALILDNLRLFILKIPDALTIITDLLLKWINLLASYCVTVLCYVFKSISVFVAKLWEIIVAILDSPRLFVLKITNAWTSITHHFLEGIYLLASYCLTVPSCVLESISVFVTELWEMMVALLDNLRLFILKISDTLTSIIHRSLESIYSLASYFLTVPSYVLESISVFVAKLWEIIVVILDSLRLFVLKISNALTSITHHCPEWIYLLASYCLTVPSYVLESISVFVTKLWEMMVARLENLRFFILKIFDASTSIIYHLLKWIYVLSLYCLTSPCYVLKSISIVVAKLWEIMMAILDNLRMFILKIYNTLTSITHHFLEWINLLASYCVSVPRSVLKSISVVVVRLCVITVTNLAKPWEIIVAVLDSLRLFIIKVPDALTRITHRFSKWIIGRVYDTYQRETNEGDHPREGKTLTARFY